MRKDYNMDLFSVTVIIGDDVWKLSAYLKCQQQQMAQLEFFFKLDNSDSLSAAGLPMGKYITY